MSMTVTRHRSLDTLLAYAHEVDRDKDPAEGYVCYTNGGDSHEGGANESWSWALVGARSQATRRSDMMGREVHYNGDETSSASFRS